MEKILKTKTVAFIIYLLLLIISFILPFSVLSIDVISFFILFIVIIILLLILYRFHRKTFIPALFFVIDFVVRYLVLFFIQYYKLSFLSFPGAYCMPSILIYITVIYRIPSFKKEITWNKWGKIDLVTLSLIALIVLSSALALIFWSFCLAQDLTGFTKNIPAWPLQFLILGGIGFSLSNAVVEELIARGLLWDGFQSMISKPAWIIILQAAVFAAFHYKGFPGGISGSLMVFIWSIFLGIIRYRSKGLFPPVLAHIFADSTLFIILIL